MKDAAYKWLKLASDNKKTLTVIFLFFLGGSGIGYNSHPYLNQQSPAETPTNQMVKKSPNIVYSCKEHETKMH